MSGKQARSLESEILSLFNDIDRIENPLVQYYQSQFNFEVKPNFNDLVTFMTHKQDIKKGQDEKKDA
jgi:hypothetical protein